MLQPYLPEWERCLSLPEQPFREGTHIFKVSLGPIWRRIAAPTPESLDALASAIITSVAFDHDHLYKFSYLDRFGAPAEIIHPYVEEGQYTSEVVIGDVPLGVGQTMTFIYDFGDRWEFDVTLERIEQDLEIAGPAVIEAHGEAPEQYPRGADW